MNFCKKNYTTIIRTYWATKYEIRRDNKFGRLAAVCLMHADISICNHMRPRTIKD